jgi:hypothetical protein
MIDPGLLVDLGGVVVGKIGYMVKKRALDNDKGDDESELDFVVNWVVKSPVTTLISLILALGALQVLPSSEDVVKSFTQAMVAAMASDSVANQKGVKT